MTLADPLLDLVDSTNLRRLFVEELGWNNPDRRPQSITASDDQSYTFDQVASYHGLRVWHCPKRPSARVQRELDHTLSKDSYERLVIFTDEHRHDWRWPRRSDTTGANARLLTHPHTVGEYDPNLLHQLQAITIDMDAEPSLAELLAKMRAAFDQVAESASVRAARHMRTLYSELNAAGISDEHATLLLARLLFLLFGDDSGMWAPQPANQFYDWLVDHTTADDLHIQLGRLFDAVDKPEINRDLPAHDPLATFRYINGGLFHDPLPLSPLTADFREGLIDACTFDWQVISPAVFGSMFQTVKSKAARRAGGEHYTTEENILRTINPLFLDECRGRLQAAWDSKAQLTRLHNYLGGLRVLDPACGCGNFLVVAYRELRALELELLKRRRHLDEQDRLVSGRSYSQMSFDVTGDLQVTLDHFYGIEINDWPARIAETALLLVDHLANQQMAEEFGVAPDRLPIEIAPKIVHANALTTRWSDVIAPGANVIVVGNPPFIGQYGKTEAQRADAKRIWGDRYNGYLDYVTAWYAATIDFFGSIRGRWAYVSTNSICQGMAVEPLWRPILDAGWRCRFAHRSFQWVTEGADGAAVHVSILGFDREAVPKARLWTYREGGRGPSTEFTADEVSPYLIPDAPPILVTRKMSPLSPSLPKVTYGSKPTDDGQLMVRADQYDVVMRDPVASKYVRRFVGADELIHNLPRWCLWLVNAPQADLVESTLLASRIREVRRTRMLSKDASTRKAAARPSQFQYIRQPSLDYLAIPAHVSEHRPFFLAGYFSADVICGNANFMVEDPDGIVLGVLSSTMFVEWMRAIGGRLESRLRFANTIAYNCFPLPRMTALQQSEVSSAAASLIAVRASYGDQSLGQLYEPGRVPNGILEAHKSVDDAVDSVFGISGSVSSDGRNRLLLNLYEKATSARSRP